MSAGRHMISQDRLDYSLPDKIYLLVKNDLIKYPATLEEAQRDIDNVLMEKYNLYPMIAYGDFLPYTTPGFHSKTAEIADLAGMDRIRIEDARRKVDGIKRGIKRAAYTCDKANLRKKILTDLTDSLLNKFPNQSKDPDKAKRNINRDPRSLRKYKERAYYFIAVELGYISIDKDIRLAENQLNRVIGNE